MKRSQEINKPAKAKKLQKKPLESAPLSSANIQPTSKLPHPLQACLISDNDLPLDFSLPLTAALGSTRCARFHS
jgi:hypothetical protein